MKKAKAKTSEQLKELIDFIASCNREYRFCKEQIETEDKLTQDLLHHLELNKTSSKERNQIAKELTRARQNRRYYKDRAEEIEPLVTFFETIQNIKVMNQLPQVLGAVRKAEKRHENRTYTPRVWQEKEDAE